MFYKDGCKGQRDYGVVLGNTGTTPTFIVRTASDRRRPTGLSCGVDDRCGRKKEASMLPSPPVLSWLLHLIGMPLKDVPYQWRTVEPTKWSDIHGPRVKIASPTVDRPLNSRRPHLRPKVKFPDRVCEAYLSGKRCMRH